MKRITALVMALSIVMLAACNSSKQSSSAGGEGESGSKPIVLKFGTHLTDNHCLTTHAVNPWMEKVTELTDGQVTFEYYGNSQMGKAADALSLLNTGVLDCSYTLYMVNDVPVTDFMMLPGLYEDCDAATKAYWEVLNQEPFASLVEEQGVKPIMCVAWEPYTIATVDDKVTSYEDLSKLKLRSSGGLHDEAAAALGISPVTIGAAETLEALSKKTVDGCWGSTTSWTDYQFTQVLKYGITNLPLNGWAGMFCISLDTYNSLPENVQQAIDQACAEMNEELSHEIAEICEQGWVDAEEAGVECYEVGQAMCDRIEETLKPLTEKWLAEQDAAGYPATEIYNQFNEAYAKYAS